MPDCKLSDICSLSELRVRSLLAAAEYHKDRLHSLQATEWNVYYAVWAVVLASIFFILTGAHTLLPDLASGLTSYLSGEWSVRAVRAFACLLFISCFYRMVFMHYFYAFYPKNYESIVKNRTRFGYYLNKALYEAHEASPSSSSAPTTKYRIIQKKKGAAQASFLFFGFDAAHFLDWLLRIKDNAVQPEKRKNERLYGPEELEQHCGFLQDLPDFDSEEYTVDDAALPHLIESQAENFNSSKIFLGRKEIMGKFMIFAAVAVFVVGFLAPLDNDLKVVSPGVDRLLKSTGAKTP